MKLVRQTQAGEVKPSELWDVYNKSQLSELGSASPPNLVGGAHL